MFLIVIQLTVINVYKYGIDNFIFLLYDLYEFVLTYSLV